MKYFSLILLLISSCFNSIIGQKAPFKEGQLLVQLHPSEKIESVLEKWNSNIEFSAELILIKEVSIPLSVYQLEVSPPTMLDRVLVFARNSPQGIHIQKNHILSSRSNVPNDPQYADQWQYNNTGQSGGTVGADIDADLAWDITTGGLTALGDTIVLCVIDDGLDLNHDDFGNNVWINHHEIPNNGIDDDNNGYIDDYQGWNADFGNDDIAGGGHGTPVAGICGAQGNNSNGVSGVNWDVKLMIVVGGGDEAAAIAAYSYPLVQRQMYNSSNGQEGAFVVGTNASWGIDFGQPEDAPIWCALYDTLGKHGVLSAGATINNNTNVDIEGDLPTACPSDYIISVTNMNDLDQKETFAGYGLETIDLGAFGAGTITPQLGNGYGPFGGTSGATPHVTGAIGLIYSVPCPDLATLAHSDPEGAAAFVRAAILGGVDPNPSLQGITTTGGRLNLHTTLLIGMGECSDSLCLAPYSLGSSDVTGTDAILNWTSFGGTDSVLIEYTDVMSGTGSWLQATSTSTMVTVENLTPCTEYVFQVSSYCGDSIGSISQPFYFSTNGCCIPPQELVVLEKSDDSIVLGWDSVLAAISYVMVYGSPDGQLDTIEGISEAPYAIHGLEPCEEYEFFLFSLCDTGWSGEGVSLIAQTSGCGACEDLPYCESWGGNSSEEWIAEVSLNNWTNSSGDNDGYGNFLFTGPVISPDSTYDIGMSPGFLSYVYDEVFRVWIDYNANGDFTDSGELVFESSPSGAPVSSVFTVPDSVPHGNVRMRFSMGYEAAVGSCAEGFDFGEVEDYCVEIGLVVSNEDKKFDASFIVYPNPYSDKVTVKFSNLNSDYIQVDLMDLTGKVIDSSIQFIDTKRGLVTFEPKRDISSGLYLLKCETSNGQKIIKLRKN